MYSSIKVGLRPVIRHMFYVVAVLLLTAAILVVLAWLPAPAEPVRIENAIEIARSPDTVFGFTTTPSTWTKWHPATLSVEGVTQRTPRMGEQVTEDYRSGGVLGRTRWTVVEHDSPLRWRIEGRGRFGEQTSITYTFVPTPIGTRFERELQYRMPNRLAAWLELLVRRRIADESATALRQLKSVLEAQTPG